MTYESAAWRQIRPEFLRGKSCVGRIAAVVQGVVKRLVARIRRRNPRRQNLESSRVELFFCGGRGMWAMREFYDFRLYFLLDTDWIHVMAKFFLPAFTGIFFVKNTTIYSRLPALLTCHEDPVLLSAIERSAMIALPRTSRIHTHTHQESKRTWRIRSGKCQP